jgi:hypothetical protein
MASNFLQRLIPLHQVAPQKRAIPACGAPKLGLQRDKLRTDRPRRNQGDKPSTVLPEAAAACASITYRSKLSCGLADASERRRVKPDLGSGDLIADAAPFRPPWLCFVRITFMSLDATLDGDLPLIS